MNPDGQIMVPQLLEMKAWRVLTTCEVCPALRKINIPGVRRSIYDFYCCERGVGIMPDYQSCDRYPSIMELWNGEDSRTYKVRDRRRGVEEAWQDNLAEFMSLRPARRGGPDKVFERVLSALFQNQSVPFQAPERVKNPTSSTHEGQNDDKKDHKPGDPSTRNRQNRLQDFLSIIS